MEIHYLWRSLFKEKGEIKINKLDINDYIGGTFGLLTVLEKDFDKSNITKHTWVNCKCACEDKNIISIKLSCVIHGKTKSCGCIQKKITKERSLTHGKSNTRIYRIYLGMKERCYNKNNPKYPSYGGRGISICEVWLNKENGFLNFYEWAIKHGYHEGLSIERINVHGNYEPSNCKWITMEEQAKNKTCSVIVNYNNEEILLIDLLRRLGREKEYKKVKFSILKNNYDIVTALELPNGNLEQGKYFFKKFLYRKFSEIETGQRIKRSEIYQELKMSKTTFRKYLNEPDIEELLSNLKIKVDKLYLIKT